MSNDYVRYKNLHLFLREIMQKHNWTQTELAAELGTLQPNVSYWMNGNSFPNEEHKKAIAELDGMTYEGFEYYLDTGQRGRMLRKPTNAATAYALLSELDREEKGKLIIRMVDDLVIIS